MRRRWSSTTFTLAAGTLSLLGTVVTPASAAVARPATSTCTHALLSPFVQSARQASAAFVAELAAFGGTRVAISDITITLANGTKVNFSFSGRHFTVRGTDVPAACKVVTAPDDWTF